ncbi:uncharacterized protein TRIVIDRAFT_219103 [Trichoderma virens Gv29-8]|uniref:Fungal N-terminal domain-containing protein n=1 Tax=Hypocrea virens (strain Gv29-8 / FGSC 10586) TaxID=413071 RepID=G9MIL4_HYPVG|nr:uncharacterized protein TRIVIDRAFT_219103 [Trichoderma virens Gv29-8]EHK25331.1 hypothetical protein TRIVIDRAFT_219103 [Trichoderma virens Gv29-8]UKZ48848.1 hypothetical protein TrVGV298_003083 [Trichoderma virens]
MGSRIEILDTTEVVVGLGSRIYSFFSSIEDAPEEVRQMCAQLQLLQKLFPEIGRSTSDLIQTTIPIPDVILACLKACESDFKTMWLAVEPLRTNPGIKWKDALRKAVTSAKWVLKSEEFEKLTRHLETVKQTLALAMLLAGMRVDSAVLEELSSIDTKLDEYGHLFASRLHNVHTNITFQLKRIEHRLLQRVDALFRAAAEIHGQSDLRVTEIYDSFTSSGLPQAGELSAMQSLDGEVDFEGSRDIDGSTVENRVDIVSQATQDDKVDASVSAALQYAIQEWKTGVNPFHGEMNTHNMIEERQAAKRADQFSQIFINIERSELSALIFNGVRALLEAASLWQEYSNLLDEALKEMQAAFETCAQEYELYPEPRLKGLITALITDSFSGMANVLRVLPMKAVQVPQWTERRHLGESWENYKDRVTTKNREERGEVLRSTVMKIRQSSRRVREEVEYLHRKELRQAHLRLREVDRKQDQVIRALEEQQKILISLQEEHKALSLISDHQKVLQMLQQLLTKFPPPDAIGAPVGVPVNTETSTVSE